MRRRDPRPASEAIAALADRLAPATTLAAVQRVWPQVVGDVVAAQAVPTGERDGVLRITCASSVWANELDLMAPALVDRLNAALEGEKVHALRCSCAPAKGWL